MQSELPRKQKRSRKQRIYTIASNTWTITSWIWTAIIIVFVIQFIPTYLFSSTSQTWEAVLNWLNNDVMAFPWNVLRIFAIIAIPLLAGLTILSWMLKRSLREQSEGFDRLIEVLEHDIVTPQLEILQDQFQRLLQKQATNVDILSHLEDRLQQMPVSTDLNNLQTEESNWNKKIHQALQDIHTRTTEQVEWLGDLFQQRQHTEERISGDLHAIAYILEQLQNKLEIGPLSDQPISKAESDQLTTTERFEVVATPLPLDLLESSGTELIEESEPELAEHGDNQPLNT